MIVCISHPATQPRRHTRRLVRPVFLLLIAIGLTLSGIGQSSPNDHIFPATEKAKSFIDFDGKGFLINGHREFLVSAGMEYARVPRELWYDRLLRLKRCGFNCIEIYTFWNFHEPEEGKFNFSGDHDLDAFLKLVKKMDMYVIARVGPYYCAEWDNGGYPLWLRFKPGLQVREDNAPFEKYTDLFFDTLMPIVCRNQINHGGAVIMLQLENEHPEGWGTDMPNGYFQHLQKKALSFGLDVPYFFSGLHHASDPAENEKLDDPKRPNPWMSTEFWSVWFSGYSSADSDAVKYERRTWKIIANGGNGYNYYMAHGGSNFGYTNNNEDAASYDYGAAVGQAGDLRPIYYSFKRTALFARSFQDILENSTEAVGAYKNSSSNQQVQIRARHSPAGDILFLHNPGDAPQTTTISLKKPGFPSGYTLDLSPDEMFPVVIDFKIGPEITLQWSLAKILGMTRTHNSTTIVLYGKPGTAAAMQFYTTGKLTPTGANPAFSPEGRQVKFHTLFSNGDKPGIYSFKMGRQTVFILTVNENLSNRTWFIDQQHKQYIVAGPSYVSQVRENNKIITVSTERAWRDKGKRQNWIFSAPALAPLQLVQGPIAEKKTALPLSPWQIKTAAEPAAPAFDDLGWKETDDPAQMGSDGDLTADAWYRTHIRIDTAGTYTLQLKGGDRAGIFVDGKRVSTVNIKDGEINLNLSKGKQVLAIFTAHDGRDKLAGLLGAMDHADAKGLYGKVLLAKEGAAIQNLTAWRFLKAASANAADSEMPPQNDSSWTDYSIGQDAFDLRKGFGWFSTTLKDPSAAVKQIQLEFRSVDENAIVFVNGRRLGKHEGWNNPFDFTIDGADTLKKPITLTVFVENYSNEGGIDQPVHANELLPSTQRLTVWRMRGGIADPEKIKDWSALDEKNSWPGPCFFRSSFNAATSPNKTTYRVVTKGLGHGSVWVNGYNLGRYPEKIPINGLYIPECWIKNGLNSICIYDEDGRYPRQVSVAAEEAASRELEEFKVF